jgi:hypothetical protein
MRAIENKWQRLNGSQFKPDLDSKGERGPFPLPTHVLNLYHNPNPNPIYLVDIQEEAVPVQFQFLCIVGTARPALVYDHDNDI